MSERGELFDVGTVVNDNLSCIKRWLNGRGIPVMRMTECDEDHDASIDLFVDEHIATFSIQIGSFDEKFSLTKWDGNVLRHLSGCTGKLADLESVIKEHMPAEAALEVA
jgi:hypothetical protein